MYIYVHVLCIGSLVHVHNDIIIMHVHICTCTCLSQILCIGSLVHNDVSLDKPPSTPFQTDFCGI